MVDIEVFVTVLHNPLNNNIRHSRQSRRRKRSRITIERSLFLTRDCILEEESLPNSPELKIFPEVYTNEEINGIEDFNDSNQNNINNENTKQESDTSEIQYSSESSSPDSSLDLRNTQEILEHSENVNDMDNEFYDNNTNNELNDVDDDEESDFYLFDEIWDSAEEFSERWDSQHYHSKTSKRIFVYPHLVRRKKKHKQPKVNPKRYVKSLDIKRADARRDQMIYHINNKKRNSFLKYGHLIPTTQIWDRRAPPLFSFTDTPYNRVMSFDNFQIVNEDITQAEFDQLQFALQLSRNEVAACGLTYQQIFELQTRELSPEDYELLSRLDEKVAKKTLRKEQVENFPSFEVTNDNIQQFSDPCSICMSNYEVGDTVKTIPCGNEHTFHSHCIDQWLTTSSVSCPLCKVSLEIFFQE